MRRATTPIVEPFAPDPSFILVTFVYRDSVNARNILVSNGPAGWEETLMTMTPIRGTNIWYRTVVLPGTVRVGYQFRVNDPNDPVLGRSQFPRGIRDVARRPAQPE